MKNMGEYRDVLKNKWIFLVIVIWEKVFQFKVLKQSKNVCYVPLSSLKSEYLLDLTAKNYERGSVITWKIKKLWNKYFFPFYRYCTVQRDESGWIGAIKEWGAEVFRKIVPPPFLWEPFKDSATSRTRQWPLDTNCQQHTHLCQRPLIYYWHRR